MKIKVQSRVLWNHAFGQSHFLKLCIRSISFFETMHSVNMLGWHFWFNRKFWSKRCSIFFLRSMSILRLFCITMSSICRTSCRWPELRRWVDLLLLPHTTAPSRWLLMLVPTRNSVCLFFFWQRKRPFSLSNSLYFW